MTEAEKQRAIYGHGDWLFPREVAALLGVSTDKVNRLRRAGAFDATNLANSTEGRPVWRYSRASVLAWIRKRTVEAAA